MTLEIGLSLGILAAALLLFVSERLRMDLVALLVLGALALTGLVTPEQALSGFSNPAVVTVWAMFILSAGLTHAGVVGLIGRRVLNWAGDREVRMIVVIMLTTGTLSAFMNNIGVAALMLPVVIDLARRTGRPPSRLLMPLAFGSLLGGLTTLIGTPPNLLASESLRERGLPAFEMFDFTPLGGAVMLVGVAFVALVGRRWLPRRDPGKEAAPRDLPQLREIYAQDGLSAVVRVEPGSALVGRTLEQTRLGSAAGLNVYAIVRDGRTDLAPGARTRLEPGDRLLVEGRLDRFEQLRGWQELVRESRDPGLYGLMGTEVALRELSVSPGAELVGRSLGQSAFRRRFGAIVVALRRESRVLLSNLADTRVEAHDRLLVEGRPEQLDELRKLPEFERCEQLSEQELADGYGLQQHLFTVRVPESSVLIGESLVGSRLGDALGLGVLGLLRDGRALFMPEPDEKLRVGDRLLVRGERDALEVFRGLQELKLEDETPKDLSALESAEVGLVEAMLSPRSRLAGKTLRELDFRRSYGLRVLAILREGQVLRSGLRDTAVRFGDELLLIGPREKIRLFARQADFLVLTHSARELPRPRRAPAAVLIMAAVLVPVLLGWLPIAIAAVIGATLMVLSGCLSMEEAYRAIEWRSVFLIAGMLPLGIAMQQSGAAAYLAEHLLAALGPLGPYGILAGLYLFTALATSVIPTAALVVLMAPIVYRTAAATGLSTHALMMAVAISASASFTSPISHPANILVMGPGGYRFVDYVKLGVPLTLVVFVVVMLLLPWIWPL